MWDGPTDVGLHAGHQDRVAAPGSGLAQGDGRAGEELGHRVAVLGEPGDGTADRERQVVAVAELEADRGERLADGLGARHERPDRRPLDRDQELVRAVATDRERGLDERLEAAADRADGLVPRGVAPGVVEDPEVVDVEDRDLEAVAGLAEALDRGADGLDQGAVVEHPGERVAAGRLDQRDRLAGDPLLGGAEDEVQHARGRDRGADRHDHHVPPRGVDRGP